MDMEKLTKQQIVLVTLLVSFMTSIATGIVTVALMDQAPAGVTQTINRVVERTIEKVVTEPATNNKPEVVVTRETIVVKEDDKIVESVDKNKASIVRIYTETNDESRRVFVGLGTLVSNDGLIMTGDVFADLSGQYLVTVDNNTFYEVKVLPKNINNSLYFLKVIVDEKNPASFVPVVFSDSSGLKLGQTVIAWGGISQNSVSTGIVSSLIDVEGKSESSASSSESTTAREIIAINTNINLADSLSGGPLLNLYGEVVGLRISSGIANGYTFLPSNILKSEVASYASIQ